jgi:EAL domain-containing protein (putative c-di-GMP-specific phosphodiesterase class I)
MAFLESGGCDEMQGYYFSRPLSVADAEHKMSRTDPQRLLTKR